MAHEPGHIEEEETPLGELGAEEYAKETEVQGIFGSPGDPLMPGKELPTTQTTAQKIEGMRWKEAQEHRAKFVGAAEGVTAAAHARAAAARDKAGTAAKGGAQMEKDIERGVAEGLAASDQRDIRSLSAGASEARAAGAGKVLETELAAGSTMMEAEEAAGEAHATAAEQAKAIKEAGSEAEDLAVMDKELNKKMGKIIKKNKSWINDDEYAMYYEIMGAVAHLPENHMLRLKYEQKARDIKSGKWDV